MTTSDLLKQFDKSCFCTEESLKHATVNCKYDKDAIKSFLSTSLTSLIEELVGEMGKRKIEAGYVDDKDLQLIHEIKAQDYNSGLDTAIEILNKKLK